MVCVARSSNVGPVPDPVDGDIPRDSATVSLLSRSAYLPGFLPRFHRKLLSWKRFSLDESKSIVALYCDGRSRIALSSSAE